jgi:hypothetical protein
MTDYMQRIRDTWNKCYRLTIGEKDLAELGFAGLSAGWKDKMEGSRTGYGNQKGGWIGANQNSSREFDLCLK